MGTREKQDSRSNKGMLLLNSRPLGMYMSSSSGEDPTIVLSSEASSSVRGESYAVSQIARSKPRIWPEKGTRLPDPDACSAVAVYADLKGDNCGGYRLEAAEDDCGGEMCQV